MTGMETLLRYSSKYDNEQLDFYLNRKNSFGFNTENNEDVVGWIILRKKFPNPHFLELIKESEEPEMHKAQMKIKNEPYLVWVAQMKRENFESDKFPGEDDCLLNTSYTFKTLEDVDGFLKEMGYELSAIKWAADVDFL